jgi:hypothetical protein
MTADPPVSLYGPIYGSLYFATVMSTCFYGVTCMQTFFYYVHYQNDPMRIKSFATAVWALNTVHEALVISGAYKYIMAGLVNPPSLLDGIPELILQLVFTALVAIATQGFFVYRIYAFSEKNIVTPFIWVLLAIYQLVSVLVFVTKALYSADGVHVVQLLELSDRFFTDIGTSSLSIAAGVDILIAAVLTFLLVRKRTTTAFSSTAYILQRLTVFAVNAGIWTATFAVLSLILLRLYPSQVLYAVFGFPLCSVYCNTLLANLNARTYIRGDTTAYNTEADLFTSSTSRASDGTKGGKHRSEPRVVSFRTSANVEGHGGVTFLVADRPASTPPTSETCV